MALKAGQLETKARQLEANQEESRRVIVSLRNENAKLTEETELALQSIAELSSSQGKSSEDALTQEVASEVASVESKLQRIKSEADIRGESLTSELETLTQERGSAGKSSDDNWFAVIASPYNETDLMGRLRKLDTVDIRYPLHVYKTVDMKGVPVYAITLGGYLSREDASKRVSYARSTGIADDAYPWSSDVWGRDVRGRLATD